MKIIYGSNANKGGIYQILNTANGRIYIGSTYRFKMRGPAHSNQLIKKEHSNTFLQNDFNKCGPEAFIFQILKVVEGDEKVRIQVEQTYIDEYYDNQKQCYNLDKKAGRTRKGKKNKDIYDPTTDGRSKPKTNEWRKVTSDKNKEFWNRPEQKKFASDRAKKKWKNHNANIRVVHTETGEDFLIEGSVRQFCIDRQISYKAFHLMVKGNTKSSAGWRLEGNR